MFVTSQNEKPKYIMYKYTNTSSATIAICNSRYKSEKKRRSEQFTEIKNNLQN